MATTKRRSKPKLGPGSLRVRAWLHSAIWPLREALARALRDAVRDTRSPFGDPWGLVAVALAAGGRAAAQVEIVGAEFALRLPGGLPPGR